MKHFECVWIEGGRGVIGFKLSWSQDPQSLSYGRWPMDARGASQFYAPTTSVCCVNETIYIKSGIRGTESRSVFSVLAIWGPSLSHRGVSWPGMDSAQSKAQV